jgi:adenosine deaminase
MRATGLFEMKKAELHLHLDGSLRTDTVRELAIAEGILDETIASDAVDKMLKVDEETRSLIDYLQRFDLPVKVMQTRENLSRVAFELVEDLAKENYIYAEIRFAPHLHTAKGLRSGEIVEAVLSGVRKGEREYPIRIGVILCMMRHLPASKGPEIVKLASEYGNRGVVGIDLAGDEKNFSPLIFRGSFDLAKERKVKVTIHAGESLGPKSVADALDMGAARIGHGIRSIEDTRVVDRLVREGIALEVCPTSNLQTKVYPDFSNYPLKELIKKGVTISLNTDNRKVSDTNLTKEMGLIMGRFGIGRNEIRSMVGNSIRKSFLPDDDKEEMLASFEN